MSRVLETSYCTDRAKSPLYALRPGVNFLLRLNHSCALSLYAPPRRKRALVGYTRSLAFLLDTPRDLVMSSSPRGVILSSHRVSTRHSRQTIDTNRLFIRSQQESEADMSDLFDCTYASSYPLSQSASPSWKNHPRACKESRRSGDLRIQIEESY